MEKLVFYACENTMYFGKCVKCIHYSQKKKSSVAGGCAIKKRLVLWNDCCRCFADKKEGEK